MEQPGRQRKSANGGEEEKSACQSCRRRKLRCSREVPSCSQCSRLDSPCNYSSTRQKPGMKSGAVEALSRRVNVLEEMLLQEGGAVKQAAPAPQLDAQHSIYHVSMLLVKELQRLQSNPCRNIESGESWQQLVENNPDCNTRKRKRHESRNRNSETIADFSDSGDLLSSLPPEPVLEKIVRKYFEVFQPWIPFLHQRRFMVLLSDQEARVDLAVVLHAMVCVTMRFAVEEEDGIGQARLEQQVRRSRQLVLLTTMEFPSIVHLQALIIIVFDYVGGGQVAKAWSLIGSLTRTVEYLRLTLEPDELQQYPLRKPLSLLETPSGWTEIEERRRLFWNIFLLDRFCSVTTGWSTSLTSDDVHRKLPCDGGLWAREEMSDTPYFGIWNKSSAKIGNSVAYIPAHYPTPDHDDHEAIRSPGVIPSSGHVDTSKLGAFAYCIEATESLSQVTTFFLQQKVDFKNRQEVGSWLTRFKELDLRLVHWKMFLPQKWKDSNISRDITLIDMDPNLTLAHITHNTSMILLHQHIAYPPSDWGDIVKLPSSCSAETCLMAAVETVSITQKYLKYTTCGIVNSQFALCAFVAGRILLVHCKYYQMDLLPEFFSIVECLKEMSTRWQGLSSSEDSFEFGDENYPQKLDLAGKYCLELQSIHRKIAKNPKLWEEVLGYSTDLTEPRIDGLLPPSTVTREGVLETQNYQVIEGEQHWQKGSGIAAGSTTATSSDTNTKQAPGFLTSNSQHQSPQSPRIARILSSDVDAGTRDMWQPLAPSNQMTPEILDFGSIPDEGHRAGNFDSQSMDDELTAMSNILLGQQFMEMDRVITFNGTNFAIDMDNWQSMG